MLNGRIEPTGAVEGFTVDIGASGSFCPKHVTLPVAAFFFTLSDDNAPSPYLVSVISHSVIVCLMVPFVMVNVEFWLECTVMHYREVSEAVLAASPAM